MDRFIGGKTNEINNINIERDRERKITMYLWFQDFIQITFDDMSLLYNIYIKIIYLKGFRFELYVMTNSYKDFIM